MLVLQHMVDLSMRYMGLPLRSPLVPSASPLTRSLANVRHMEDGGAGAVVLHSLFQEQVLLAQGRHPFEPWLALGVSAAAAAAARRYFPDAPGYRVAPEAYVEHVRRAAASVDIPVIGSLNGVSPGEWLAVATDIEAAGASALELGSYYLPVDPGRTSAEIEQWPVDLLQEVKRVVRIAVAVKLSPYYTNLTALTHRLAAAGADALVLFQRFYQPDIDLQTLALTPRPTLSTLQAPEALRLPLRWIALLHGRVAIDLAGSGGVHDAPDALKLLLAGATVAMLASELLLHGIGRLGVIRRELDHWLDELGFGSAAQARGQLSQQGVAVPLAFERAQYLRVAADPHFRPTADHAPDRPTWQPDLPGYRGYVAPTTPPRPRNVNAGDEWRPADNRTARP